MYFSREKVYFKNKGSIKNKLITNHSTKMSAVAALLPSMDDLSDHNS